MGRGRMNVFLLCISLILKRPSGTTTGMVTACLIATTANWNKSTDDIASPEENGLDIYDSIDGPSEEEAYLEGERQHLHYIATLFL